MMAGLLALAMHYNTADYVCSVPVKRACSCTHRSCEYTGLVTTDFPAVESRSKKEQRQTGRKEYIYTVSPLVFEITMVKWSSPNSMALWRPHDFELPQVTKNEKIGPIRRLAAKLRPFRMNVSSDHVCLWPMPS
jgi:hypothetical protein